MEQVRMEQLSTEERSDLKRLHKGSAKRLRNRF